MNETEIQIEIDPTQIEDQPNGFHRWLKLTVQVDIPELRRSVTLVCKVDATQVSDSWSLAQRQDAYLQVFEQFIPGVWQGGPTTKITLDGLINDVPAPRDPLPSKGNKRVRLIDW